MAKLQSASSSLIQITSAPAYSSSRPLGLICSWHLVLKSPQNPHVLSKYLLPCQPTPRRRRGGLCRLWCRACRPWRSTSFQRRVSSSCSCSASTTTDLTAGADPTASGPQLTNFQPPLHFVQFSSASFQFHHHIVDLPSLLLKVCLLGNHPLAHHLWMLQMLLLHLPLLDHLLKMVGYAPCPQILHSSHPSVFVEDVLGCLSSANATAAA